MYIPVVLHRGNRTWLCKNIGAIVGAHDVWVFCSCVAPTTDIPRHSINGQSPLSRDCSACTGELSEPRDRTGNVAATRCKAGSSATSGHRSRVRTPRLRALELKRDAQSWYTDEIFGVCCFVEPTTVFCVAASFEHCSNSKRTVWNSFYRHCDCPDSHGSSSADDMQRSAGDGAVPLLPSPPIDNIWVMVIVWTLEVKREYYQNSSVLDCGLWIVHSPQHTYVSSSYRFNRLSLSHWDPYTVQLLRVVLL